MSAEALIPHSLPRWTLIRFRVESFAYALSLACIVLSFYAYWILWKLKIYYMGWALALVLLLLLAVHGRLESKGLLRALAPILGWYVYLTASALWSPDPLTTLEFVAAGVIFPVAFAVSYIWVRNLSMWQLSSYFLVQALLLMPIVVWTLLRIGRMYDDSLGAVRTGLALAMLTALPFLVWRARTRPSTSRSGLVALAMLVLLGSASRSAALIGIIALFAGIAFVQRRRGRRFRGLVAAIGGVALVAGLAMILPPVRAGLSQTITKLSTETAFDLKDWIEADHLITSSGDFATDLDRRVQALVAFQSFVAHPIRGNGYFSTYIITRESFWVPVAAHGLPAMLLGETGMIGTAIFLWLLVRFFRRTSAARRRATNLQEQGFWETCRWTMVTMLLFGLFHQIDQSPQFFIMLAWGYAAAPPS